MYHPLIDPPSEVERRELRRMLDQELRQLPEKYRAPVVLCDLEGQTHEEAARQLGWPAGSMSRRLDRARALLRRRLIFRGMLLVICLVGGALGALGALSLALRVDNATVAIRRAMTPLKPMFDRESGVGDVLAGVVPNRSESRKLGQVASFARQAAQIAAGIERHDPGKNQDAWREYVDEMRASAVMLAQATDENDAFGMLSAARRLETSCQKCHKLFCQ
jgi:RNA polymerase sigma-70 factor (ECF subfamily)